MDSTDTKAPTSWGRALIRAVAIVVGLLVLFEVVTLFTGFPGTGTMRRYSAHDLDALAARINDNGKYVCQNPNYVATCKREPDSPSMTATVDWIASRVRVHQDTTTAPMCFSALQLTPRQEAMLTAPLKFTCVASSGGP